MKPPSRLPQPDWPLKRLKQHFGQIPGDRILLDPPPGTATEEHLLQLEVSRGWPSELLDGVLIDRIPGIHAAVICTQLLCRLWTFVHNHDLGIVIPGWKCPVRLRPGLIRVASIFFISWDQMPDGKVPNDRITKLVPDLVGDVVTKWCTRQEMNRKRDEYLTAGTRLFWLLDIPEKCVEISIRERTRIVDVDGVLDAEDVLPGFTHPVKSVFRLPRFNDAKTDNG